MFRLLHKIIRCLLLYKMLIMWKMKSPLDNMEKLIKPLLCLVSSYKQKLYYHVLRTIVVCFGC